jgi:D-arabinose 5-phosphate isomerase GutQ
MINPDNADVELHRLLSRTRDILRDRHGELLAAARPPVAIPHLQEESTILLAISSRLDATKDQLVATVEQSAGQIDKAVTILASWMDQRAVVRVLGAGRARLAAAIPAHRLSHGGARVYIQDSLVPMPHSLVGGGILAASASGQTPSVLEALRAAKENNKEIQCVGIAKHDARVFSSLCDVFIGIQPARRHRNPLSALADTEEYIISELLDALVVAAGHRLGFTDPRWRLGHEDLGPATGPYDFLPRR